MKNAPSVSYCIFAYNQEKYIKDAIIASFNQTCENLEIIISDDCSTDRTWEIIQETTKSYKGKHKIITNKNKKNIGIGGHFSYVCYDLAKGEFIITCAGDDISKQDHVEIALNEILTNNEVGMVDFAAEIIDSNGLKTGERRYLKDITKIGVNEFVNVDSLPRFAPGRIINKKWLIQFPKINNNCPTEDSVLAYRCLYTTGYYLINKPVVHYRRHDSNLSTPANLKLLSNWNIIKQYMHDIKHLRRQNRISKNYYKIFRNRIYLEYFLRLLNYNPIICRLNPILKIQARNIMTKIYRKTI